MSDLGKLVLGVKQGETVTIGEDISITVLDTGKKVSILFVAPKETKIFRSGYKEGNDAKGNAYVRST